MEKQKIEDLIERMINSKNNIEIVKTRKEIIDFLSSLDKTNILKIFLQWQDSSQQYIEEEYRGVSIPYRENDLKKIIEIAEMILKNNHR